MVLKARINMTIRTSWLHVNCSDSGERLRLLAIKILVRWWTNNDAADRKVWCIYDKAFHLMPFCDADLEKITQVLRLGDKSCWKVPVQLFNFWRCNRQADRQIDYSDKSERDGYYNNNNRNFWTCESKRAAVFAWLAFSQSVNKEPRTTYPAWSLFHFCWTSCFSPCKTVCRRQ